jgi:hypothetical protein
MAKLLFKRRVIYYSQRLEEINRREEKERLR